MARARNGFAAFIRSGWVRNDPVPESVPSQNALAKTNSRELEFAPAPLQARMAGWPDSHICANVGLCEYAEFAT